MTRKGNTTFNVFRELEREKAKVAALLDALRAAESLLDGPIADLLSGDSMSDTGAYGVLTRIRAVIAKVSGEGAGHP